MAKTYAVLKNNCSVITIWIFIFQIILKLNRLLILSENYSR